MRMLQVLQKNKTQLDLYTTAPISTTPWDKIKATEVDGLRMFYEDKDWCVRACYILTDYFCYSATTLAKTKFPTNLPNKKRGGWP